MENEDRKWIAGASEGKVVSWTNLPMQDRYEGTHIPDGACLTVPCRTVPCSEEWRKHVTLQKTLPDKTELRYLLGIPIETAADPKTWMVEELIWKP